MKATIKWLFFIAIIVGGIYIGFRLCLPTKVIGVHSGDNYLIVKNFPILESDREKWWHDNKSYLKSEYNFPTVYSNGSYSVSIIDAENGYEEEIPDRDWLLPGGSTDHLLCFNDMNVKNRCVRKDHFLMEIHKNSEGEMDYFSYSRWMQLNFIF